MILTIALSWTLANCCPVVTQARDAGYTDKQIEDKAREYKVPEAVIAWAKVHCKKP